MGVKMIFYKKADIDKTTLAVLIILGILAVVLFIFYRQTGDVISALLGKIFGAT
jgi:hypothetical protein